MSKPENLKRPTDSLQYEASLLRHVVREGLVRPEIAVAMTKNADRIDAELKERAAKSA
ncbi:hypothetical protein ACFV3R_25520 [Streptomyces sp. NPDC059740]|uniref:hypothetical protein n=1 Tax=Streptomyces sp. NPDC059740 TaxID=3346926 RepID=UPI003647F964